MDVIVQTANEVVGQYLGSGKELSADQAGAISGILKQRKDVFLILPTGSGKSLPFQILPKTVTELKRKGLNTSLPDNPIVIVICPLVSLMKSHQKELEKFGVRSAMLGEDRDGVLRGDYEVVMGSPEAWVGNDAWKAMLLGEVYQTRVIAWVTDEVHCVPKWGIDKSAGQKVFREAFGRLGELRSVLPPGLPLLALTATATKSTIKSVVKSLHMQKPIIIQQIPDRKNIKLSAIKVSTNPEVTFQPMVEELRTKGQDMDKTLVFCKTIKECAILYDIFHTLLGDAAYVDPTAPQIASNRRIAMYHRATSETIKEVVLDALTEADGGHVRIVFATNALGMGINIRDVRHVVNYGPSADIEAYLQESGRAGRDGQQAQGYLLYHSYHLVGAEKQMKLYVNNRTTCRRQILVEHFADVDTLCAVQHLCCDVCELTCDCGDCQSDQPVFHFPKELEKVAYIGLSRSVGWEDKDDIVAGLGELSERYSALMPSLFVPSELVTGITQGLIAEVLDHSQYIFTIEYVCENIAVPNIMIAQDIVDLFHDLFEDFEYIEASVDYSSFTDTCELDYNFGDEIWSDSDEELLVAFE